MSYLSRIDHAFSDAPVLPLSENGRYVLFSDCHRGIGTSNDNFLKNQHLYFAALNYYYQHSFCYIELGDGDELWENRSFSAIQNIHSNVFWLLSLFYEEHRLFMLFGNHDIAKKDFHPFSDCCCSCSKFLSQILKIVVKNFSEIVPGKQTQKEGFRPLIF